MEEKDGIKVISVAEMRAADARTIAGGVPGAVLMKRAAQGVFDRVNELGPGWEGKRTLVITGSGNNGGDGYALASIMADHGYDVTLLRISDKLSEDGGKYYAECKEKGVPEVSIKDLPAGKFDILVDCILGTGFDGEPRGTAKDAITLINEMEPSPYVVSVDINSGMNGDTGEAVLAVKSDLTVSIGFYKTGLLTGRAPELIGKLTNVDIGITL